MAEHFVRPSSSDQWLPAGQVPGLFPVPPTAAGMQEVPLAPPGARPARGGAEPTAGGSTHEPTSRAPDGPGGACGDRVADGIATRERDSAGTV